LPTAGDAAKGDDAARGFTDAGAAAATAAGPTSGAPNDAPPGAAAPGALDDGSVTILERGASSAATALASTTLYRPSAFADRPERVVFQLSPSVKGTERRQCRAAIEALGCTLNASTRYCPAATHLVAKVAEPERTEKYLAFRAAGKPIVSPAYLFDSAARGTLLHEDAYAAVRLVDLPMVGGATTAAVYYRMLYPTVADWSSLPQSAATEASLAAGVALPFSRWRAVIFARDSIASGIASTLHAGGCNRIVDGHTSTVIDGVLAAAYGRSGAAGSSTSGTAASMLPQPSAAVGGDSACAALGGATEDLGALVRSLSPAQRYGWAGGAPFPASLLAVAPFTTRAEAATPAAEAWIRSLGDLTRITHVLVEAAASDAPPHCAEVYVPPPFRALRRTYSLEAVFIALCMHPSVQRAHLDEAVNHVAFTDA
jgi:hypothetical protein